MAKLKFGAWIPTYAWSGKTTDPRNMQRIRVASRRKLLIILNALVRDDKLWQPLHQDGC